MFARDETNKNILKCIEEKMRSTVMEDLFMIFLLHILEELFRFKIKLGMEILGFLQNTLIYFIMVWSCELRDVTVVGFSLLFFFYLYTPKPYSEHKKWVYILYARKPSIRHLFPSIILMGWWLYYGMETFFRNCFLLVKLCKTLFQSLNINSSQLSVTLFAFLSFDNEVNNTSLIYNQQPSPKPQTKSIISLGMRSNKRTRASSRRENL